MPNEVTLRLDGGLRFVAQTGSGFQVALDSRSDTESMSAPSPMELQLVALGGCTAMDVISILRKMRQEVSAYEVRLIGTRAPEHPRVYTEIVIEHEIRGTGVGREQVHRAIQLTMTRYCPVFAMLFPTVTIREQFRITDEAQRRWSRVRSSARKQARKRSSRCAEGRPRDGDGRCPSSLLPPARPSALRDTTWLLHRPTAAPSPRLCSRSDVDVVPSTMMSNDEMSRRSAIQLSDRRYLVGRRLAMLPSSPRELGTMPSYLSARCIDFSYGHAPTTQIGMRGCCTGGGGG